MPTFFRDALLVQLIRRGSRRAICVWPTERSLAIGPHASSEPGDETVDCGGAVSMPGLVNGHTHLYSALAAGMPAPPRPPRNFHEILKFIWWRLDGPTLLDSVEMSGADRRTGGGALRHDDAHRSSRFAECDRWQPFRRSKTASPPSVAAACCATKSPIAIGPTEEAGHRGNERYILRSANSARAACLECSWR